MLCVMWYNELYEGDEIMKCEVCGKEYRKDDWKKYHVCSYRCYRYKYYDDLLHMKNLIITKDEVYTLDSKRSSFGNNKFEIKLMNGKILIASLLFNAKLEDIPIRLRSKFKTNAIIGR